jgi:NAD-dependent deacetylase
MTVFVLTGAGISAESGLETFRDAGGLWDKVRVEDVATPRGFSRDPEMVYEFYNRRRRQLGETRPNAAHLALAELERAGLLTALVTQNVDDLHERAGSKSVIHMHGELKRALCLKCRESFEWPGDLGSSDSCPSCGGGLRPDVVWFGEVPYRLGDIERLLASSTIFASIGTSGVVYPAAGLVRRAKALGAETVEINLEPTGGRGDFEQGFYGPATKAVPAWVESVMAKAKN